MPRAKRIRDAGLLHHVVSRGNGRMQIFLDDVDYQKFVYVLSDVVDEYDIECWDFCLMPNHVHLALRNRHRNLSAALQHLNGEYAIWWNKRHQRVGHVLQGRPTDQIVQEDRYLMNLVRYIALNPVRAKLIQRPEAWPWSGYRCTAGFCPAPAFLSCGCVLRQFGDGEVHTLQERYVRHIVGSEDDEAIVHQFRSRQRIVGEREFKMCVLGVSGLSELGRTVSVALPDLI